MKDHSQKLAKYCQKLQKKFVKLRWNDIHCSSKDWQAQHLSMRGNLLPYTVLGEGKVTSLIMCSVHSDESTAYLCFRLVQLIQAYPDLLLHKLVIAPLINPDGFFLSRPTRTNSRKVDLNRNLPTKHWNRDAWRLWKKRYNASPRKYPGPHANSESENHFVIWLLQHFTPDKVISIHAPLNFLDLDYIDTTKATENLKKIQANAYTLALDFSRKSNSKFRDYRTFPGSLGRYGHEWKIPIYTLELPSSHPKYAKKFFTRFQKSLVYSFNVILDPVQLAHQDKDLKKMN